MTHSYREGRKVNQSGGAVTTERRFFCGFKNYFILSSPLAEARNGTLHFFSFRGSLVIPVILFKLNIKSHTSCLSRVFPPHHRQDEVRCGFWRYLF